MLTRSRLALFSVGGALLALLIWASPPEQAAPAAAAQADRSEVIEPAPEVESPAADVGGTSGPRATGSSRTRESRRADIAAEDALAADNRAQLMEKNILDLYAAAEEAEAEGRAAQAELMRSRARALTERLRSE